LNGTGKEQQVGEDDAQQRVDASEIREAQATVGEVRVARAR
jgi:hypothetical protein